MSAQLRHLIEVAAMPKVTVQILPAVQHNANASGLVIADNHAAYAEHVAGGYVFTDEQTVSALAMRFDTLRGECHKVSESTALLGRIEAIWARGASPLTAMATADSA
jgi:hypothetical protein